MHQPLTTVSPAPDASRMASSVAVPGWNHKTGADGDGLAGDGLCFGRRAEHVDCVDGHVQLFQ